MLIVCRSERYRVRNWLLLYLLFVIVTVQVLPQVDLPDTAFHEDSVPVAVKFRSVAPPVAAIAPVSVIQNQAVFSVFTPRDTPPHPTNEPLISLFSVFRC